MSITQNEKISQVKNTTLVVGIDISSETHYARAFDWRGLELSKLFKFESASYGFENFSEWLTEICKTNQKDNIIIGAEPTGHYRFTLAEYLKEHDIKFVFVNHSQGLLLRANMNIQAEGTYGVIKWNRQYKRIRIRGLKSVIFEFTSIWIGFNLCKYHLKKQKRLLAA